METDEESNEETKENVSDGSTLEGGIGEKTTKIVAATDQATYKSLEQMRDKNAEEKAFKKSKSSTLSKRPKLR